MAAWEREQRWAPRYVADELEAGHEALRKAQADATVWTARAEVEQDPLSRDELRVAAREAGERAEQLAEQVRELEFADEARDLWRVETMQTRDRAERARVAAGWRGIDLDNPAERVTAEEWLDAHQVEQLADDADRDITDADLAHDEQRTKARAADVVLPDVRDVIEPDPTERADPAQRRRVPPRDETAAVVDRARVTVDEVAQRREAEQAAAAHAAEIEPEDDARRHELTTWAQDDRSEVDTAEGEALTR